MKPQIIQQFQEDDVILRQGSTAKEMFKILSGKAAVYLNYEQPDEYLVGVLSEQRCFGEISILCGKPNIYTVVAFGEVLLLRITEDTFSDFIKNNSQNAIDIMKNLASSIATLSLNVNMLTAELDDNISAQIERPKMKDITKQVKYHVAMDSIHKTLFTLYV